MCFRGKKSTNINRLHQVRFTGILSLVKNDLFSFIQNFLDIFESFFKFGWNHKIEREVFVPDFWKLKELLQKANSIRGNKILLQSICENWYFYFLITTFSSKRMCRLVSICARNFKGLRFWMKGFIPLRTWTFEVLSTLFQNSLYSADVSSPHSANIPLPIIPLKEAFQHKSQFWAPITGFS